MNGPDVKIRGTAAHIAEKYMSLARDALASGDMVTAESYLQHAEHYNRIIMAAQIADGAAARRPSGRGANGGYRQQRWNAEGPDDEGDEEEAAKRGGEIRAGGGGDMPSGRRISQDGDACGRPRAPSPTARPEPTRGNGQREPHRDARPAPTSRARHPTSAAPS